jgi:hypothetical protein
MRIRNRAVHVVLATCVLAFAPYVLAQQKPDVSLEELQRSIEQSQRSLERLIDSAIPGFYDGNKLLTYANSNRNLFIGYVLGVHDDAKAQRAFCSPSNATSAQLADVVVKHLRDNPATRSDPAHWLVREAYTQAWPCPKPADR